MLDKGVEPFSVNAMSEDQQTSMLVYSSIGVGYRDKKEEIIPQVMPQTVSELEYRLVSTIYKLTTPKKHRLWRWWRRRRRSTSRRNTGS